jgi:ketosteroid isomerase-like protein
VRLRNSRAPASVGATLRVVRLKSRSPNRSSRARTVANKQKVEAALTAWSNGTGNIADLLSDDIRWTIVGNALVSGTFTGKPDLIEKVLKPFGARFSTSTGRFRPVAIEGIYGDGDVVVALFDGKGTTNDGKPYTNSYAWFLRLKDGLVVDATAL